MFPLSRKIKIAIERNLKALVDKTYTESTIKELLIDLREIGKRIKHSSGEGPEMFDRAFSDFIDVCDCIAHSNRIKGVLEENIRRHVEKIAATLEEGGNRPFSDVSAVGRVLNGDAIVAAMLSTIFLYLSTYDKDFDRDQLLPVFEDKADISLCIISLLQDSTIALKQGHGHALLHVLDHEGQYRLYCQVLGSSIERDARARTGGTGRLILGFPAILTNARNIDGLCFNQSDEIPKLIETYRGDDGRLHARFVNVE